MLRYLLTVTLCTCLLSDYLQAQDRLVLLEPQKRKINQGSPLPVQTPFTIQVPAGKNIGIIKVNVFKGSHPGNTIEPTSWTRPVLFDGDFAELPVNIRLRSNTRYGFDVKIYALLSDSEKLVLKEIIHRNLSSYLNATIEAGNKSFTLLKAPAQMVQDLNSIVKRNLSYYQNTQQRGFEGFSDIILLKLQQIGKIKLADADYNVRKPGQDTVLQETDLKSLYAKQVSDELQEAVFTETDNYLSLDFVKPYDAFVIANRETEKSQTVLPIFVGYGGVYLSGDINNLDYDSQPYAGLSFPIGRGNETHFGRTSFVVGIFLKNLKNGEGQTITGPIVNRPFFAGLGFRIYDFINLNAGLAATSTEKQTISTFKTENVQLKPFIGLNAQFNLWLGLGKK